MNSGCIGTYDAAGNMTEGPAPDSLSDTHKYIFDAWNRLVKVTDDAGTPATIAEYRYDGLGRRIVKVDDAAEGDPRYDYYYDRGQVVEEHLDQDETYPLAQYVWHPYYIDAPVMRWNAVTTNNSRRLGNCCSEKVELSRKCPTML